MHNSETEEGSEEEDEEEEEDICEEEEEEEEEESEEEEVNGVGGSDRVDLGVQTSLLESPSPTVPSPSSHTQVRNISFQNRLISTTHNTFRGSGVKAMETHLPVGRLIHQHQHTQCLRIFDTE